MTHSRSCGLLRTVMTYGFSWTQGWWSFGQLLKNRGWPSNPKWNKDDGRWGNEGKAIFCLPPRPPLSSTVYWNSLYYSEPCTFLTLMQWNNWTKRQSRASPTNSWQDQGEPSYHLLRKTDVYIVSFDKFQFHAHWLFCLMRLDAAMVYLSYIKVNYNGVHSVWKHFRMACNADVFG